MQRVFNFCEDDERTARLIWGPEVDFVVTCIKSLVEENFSLELFSPSLEVLNKFKKASLLESVDVPL